MNDDIVTQLEALKKHPELSELLKRLLNLADAGATSPDLADDAEEAVIEVGQAIQHYTLQKWGENKVQSSTAAQCIKGNAKKSGKKN